MKLKPKRLKQGDTIGIVAPASPIRSKSHFRQAVRALEDWGYKIKVGKHVYEQRGYMAGTDEQRATDLNAMFKDEEVAAIIVTNGGYGSARIIDMLDFDVIKNNPKIFVGFSDITSLHIAIQKYTGLVTFHGPGMVKFNPADLSYYSKDHLFKAIASEDPVGEIKVADSKHWVDTIHPGEVRTEIVGGNLALICASLGTPYEIDTKGKILLMEDWNLEPWMFDNYVNQLSIADKLQDAAGIVIGECLHTDPVFHAGSGITGSLKLEEIFDDFIKPLKKPSIYGLPLGHSRDMATVPLGAEAYLDATNGRFFIEECGTL